MKDRSFLKVCKALFSLEVDKVLNTNIKSYKVAKEPYENNKTIKVSKKKFLERREEKINVDIKDVIKELINIIDLKSKDNNLNDRNKKYLKDTITLLKRKSTLESNQNLTKVLERISKLASRTADRLFREKLEKEVNKVNSSLTIK